MAGAFNGREVKIRDGSINQLISLYKRTYARLAEEMINATEAGKIQKARVMARINVELTALGEDVDAWVAKEIPQYYLDGSNQAIQDLRAQGVDVSTRTNFAIINKEAIAALTDDVALSFAQAIRGVSRSANNLLSDALKQQLNFTIAEGRLSGDTRKMISGTLKQNLQDEGLSALTDKAGKQWTLENYTRMLARTKAVEARNQGLANRMLGLGYDLVQVTNHRSEHPACAFWEGKILSLTGKTPGYPTLQMAIEGGLFHPNCQHAINAFHPELARLTKAYDNPYNYREGAALPDELKGPGAAGVTAKHIDVYHGAGEASVNSEGSNLFGDAFYVARDKATAKQFGSQVVKSELVIRPTRVLTIENDLQYNQLVRDAIQKYPELGAQKAIPKLAGDLGYQAIEGTKAYDPLAGIAIIDRNLLK